MVQQKPKNGVDLYSLLVSVILLFGIFAPQPPAYLQLGKSIQTERLAETYQQKKSVSFFTYSRVSKNVFANALLPSTRVETLFALASITHNRFTESFRACFAFESIQALLVYVVYRRSNSADIS